MKQRIQNQNNNQNCVKIKLMGNEIKKGKQVQSPIKTENGNDMKIPFSKGESLIKKDEDACMSSMEDPFSKTCSQKSSAANLRACGKKIQPFFKNEIVSQHSKYENTNSSGTRSCTAKAITYSPAIAGRINNSQSTLIRRLQSDLTPKAILPASSGKRIHTSVISIVSDTKRLKVSKPTETSKQCKNYPTLPLKQEPVNIEKSDMLNETSESNKFPLVLYKPSNKEQNNSLVHLGKLNTQLKNFKQEDAFRQVNSRKLNSGSKCSMSNYLLNLSSSPQKTLSVSSTFISNMRTTVCGDSSTKTFISSTVVSSSSTRGRGRREIDQLYKSLKEISWAQDKDFTSLLYAKNSVRHSDRNSSIKAAITDRSKKLAKLSKGTQKETQKSLTASPKQLKQQQKMPKTVKQSVAVKPKQSSSALISMQRKIPKNANSSSSPSRQQMRMSLQNKKDTISKKHHISKKIKSKAMNQHLKRSLDQAKPLVSKQNKVCKKEKLKSAQPQLKTPLQQKKTTITKQLGVSKKDKIKEKSDHLKSSPTTVKKKIPIQSVKPMVDHEKKASLENHSKLHISKPAWQNLCKTNDVSDIFSSDTNIISAFNGPELRVTVKPLEKSQPWVSDCNFQTKLQREYDAHNRRTFQEKVRKVYASIDQTHVSSVLQEIHDSIGIFPNKAKLIEEKTKKSVRSSVRQSECAFRYKEIVVKKHDNYLQVVLVPNIQKQNSLTIDAIKELKEAFVAAKKDTNCNAVLLSSSGSFFCSGIDLSQLYGSNKKHVAEEMAAALKDLIMTLASFPKPIVAAVNGSAIGLGVSLLMYCDIILASDKATFCIPATKMGYIPEGGVTLTLPQVVGNSCAIEMLLHGKVLTAQQALKFGIVSEVLWPTQLMEEVIPRVRSLAEQSLQVMEITKTMVRCHLWEKLPTQLENEERLLPSYWLSSACQQKIKKHLQTGWLCEY